MFLAVPLLGMGKITTVGKLGHSMSVDISILPLEILEILDVTTVTIECDAPCDAP